MKMIMKYRLYLSAAMILSAVSVFAQDLDPTVVVDRAYEGKLIEVHKPSLEMAVPDSVMRFDLDFDYSVFENPYKGSYEFTPYLLSMKPSSSADREGKFYLRAGAGYSLHPELDLVWSPQFKDKGAALDVYAHNRSYIGDYHNLASENGGEPWAGSDVQSKAGVRFSYDWEKTILKVGAGYNGIIASRPQLKHAYNALDVSFSLGSRPKPYDAKFMYDVKANYKIAKDNIKSYGESVGENVLDVDARLGFATRKAMLLFDLGADFLKCDDAYKASALQFYVTPHYVYRNGRFLADLGVKIAKADSDKQWNSFLYKKQQFFYPEILLEFQAIRNAMKLSLNVTGGNTLNTYSSLLSANHHLSLDYAFENHCLLDYTMERANGVLAVDGRISSKFSYHLYGSAGFYDNALVEAVTQTPEGEFNAHIGYFPLLKVCAGADCMWKDESLMIDASFKYTMSETFLSKYMLMPAAFTGDVAVEYNWNRRVYAGVDCNFSSKRVSEVYTMGSYADLGLYAEYVTSRRLSVWGRGGNLLGMKVQRTPLYAEKGVYFTLGICLNL